ncbi:hypothetical protein C2S53_001501 [Perilla frutescens var. hirtella]|uniref:Time for coffee n=1 Tax=Perilla frutescens var. hirtella TaxID=608512 RepID=A0AAD4J2Q1_PERFH|nr:hypothetical protein C2S53_001501 [Perilla frutescens var. hirtella]
MERNRDLRRATVSAVNGLPRRRQRITTLRDSTDQDRQMELQETVRLGDRELLQKKEREREFPKRRRIDRSAAHQRSDGGESYRENSTDSSDEEYYEEEDETRIHQHNRANQLSPTSSSLSNNRRGLRTLRSSPVLRAAADEMFGVPVPRRARSSSAKRLHEYCNSGSVGFGEDLNHRIFSPSPLTVSLIGSGDSMKKKKSLERRTPISNPKRSVVQDDIEIEVAEALFDLMKQSQSQFQSSQKVDRDSINTGDELKMSKADGGKDENNAFSVQNEPSIKVNAETVLADSMKELKKEGRVEKDKFSDDPAQELVSGDGFVNKVKVGSPKESESPSCVKVNACDIQDPTVTKAHYDAIIVEAKKETKLEIDLMASPLLSSPEREAVVDMRTDPGVTTQSVRKKSEIIPRDGALAVASGMQGEKIGGIHSNQQSNLDVEKHDHDTTQQQQGRKEHKNQSPTSLLPFPIGMSGWPGVLPHPGYMPSLQTVMAINGSAKPSMIMQPPQFKFSRPRPKRCATHQYLAHSMHCHQQLIKKSLSSGSSGPATLCGTNSLNLKYMSQVQNFIPGNPLLGDFQGGQNLATASVGNGKDKSSDASVAFNATTSSKSLLQQASHPASASSFLNGPGFILPFGHHQATVMGPTSSSGSPQSASAVGNASLMSNSAGRLPINFPLPNASTAVSLNLPMFSSSNEASPYMAMLQNNGCSIPMPPFKGGSSSMPFFNPSLYPSPAFNVTQNQQQLTNSHASVQSATQNTTLSSHKQPQCLQQTSAKVSENRFLNSVTANSQSEKPVQQSHLSSKSDSEINWKNGSSLPPGFVSHSVTSSNSQAAMNFAMIPPVSVGGGGTGNKQIDHPQQGRAELIPQAYAFSFGSNSSATPVLNFSSMVQTSAMFQMLPDMSRNGNQMTHQKNFHPPEGKSVASSGQSFNYSKSDCSEISAVGPPKFDGSARNINFLPGIQPFQTSGGSVTIPSFQQHQLIQVQDQQQMHQMHLAGTGPFKSSTPHNIHGSFLTGGMLPSNSPVFDTPSFHPKWENFPRSAAPPEGSSQSATSSLVNIPQLKTSQGQAHISFGNGPSSYQGHQFVIKSESMSSLMVGSSSNSSLSRSTQRNASAVGLAAAASTPPSQEAVEASQGQKSSSPACRRNVPSILSTCPSQLPELKY